MIKTVVTQFQRFLRLESVGGILLLVSAVVAMAWANSPWRESYFAFWHLPVTVGVGPYVMTHSLGHWVNDALMVIFFFVVGLEIKRELLIGELSSLRQAMLPIMAAIGGMVVPAGLYALLNAGGDGAPGWGIPMATDIAFAIGVLTLLGPRAPFGLKVFLTAFAIVDDLGAVLVIAFFYTAQLSWVSLAVAGVITALLATLNLWNVRSPIPYVLLGIGLWLAVLSSGIHATIAGVVLALTIPSRPGIDPMTLLDRGRAYLDRLQATPDRPSGRLTAEQQAIVQELEDACDQVESPMQQLEHRLHPWVTFFIMPVFALANAGVTISDEMSLGHPVALGVILGLVLGKQIGITLFSWVSVRLGLAALPSETTYRHIYGAAWLGGIGFTMSLFVASLAFGPGVYLEISKVGILTASLIAGVIGWLYLRWFTPPATGS
jgi:NhaA family Na+:H+ antiporter